MKSLPDRIGDLKSLKELELTDLEKLNCLPSIGQLTSLEIFELEGLSSLPESIGELKGLKKLKLCSTNELSSLPDSIGQ